MLDRLFLYAVSDKNDKRDLPVDQIVVAETIAKMGPGAIPRLVFYLRTSALSLDDDVYGTAALAELTLRNIGAPAVPALIKVLFDPQRSNAAVHTLGGIGPAASEAVPALVRLYREGTRDPHMDGPHSFAVIMAINEMGSKACAAKVLLNEIAESPGEGDGMRSQARAALSHLHQCPDASEPGAR